MKKKQRDGNLKILIHNSDIVQIKTRI